VTAPRTHALLFDSLLAGGDLEQVVVDPAVRARIHQELEPLRAMDRLVVRSIAVNGSRVDVVAGDEEREWRVVFTTTDAHHVDRLDVYERPPNAVAHEGGVAVVVNGPSSAGKSTTLRALQAADTQPWIVFDEPMFGDVAVGYLIWRDRSPELHRGFLDGIAALARAGNRVAVAAGGHPGAMFDAAFEGIPTLRVGLDCDIAELTRRERGRRDVPGGHAAASADVHDGWTYDVRFDTTDGDVDELIERITTAIAALGRGRLSPGT